MAKKAKKQETLFQLLCRAYGALQDANIPQPELIREMEEFIDSYRKKPAHD